MTFGYRIHLRPDVGTVPCEYNPVHVCGWPEHAPELCMYCCIGYSVHLVEILRGIPTIIAPVVAEQLVPFMAAQRRANDAFAVLLKTKFPELVKLSDSIKAETDSEPPNLST